MAHALHQKPLLVPRPTAALVEDGEIGRVEEQQVEGLGTDSAVEEAAHSHTVQSCLGLLRAAFVQLHAVGKAIVALVNLPEGLAAAAAGVYVLTDFDTIEKAFSGAKAAEKGSK